MNRQIEWINPAEFERIIPSRYITFSYRTKISSSRENPNPNPLRIAVADSPLPNPSSPENIAALLVPAGREEDWIFSTASGHFQLLLSFSSPNFHLSRLVLIGNFPNQSSNLDSFKEKLFPLLFLLSPRSAILNGLPAGSIPFLCYEDGVIRSEVVEKIVGFKSGEMVVEDVEIDLSPASPEFRRRLRFKRMPNLIQTEVRLLPRIVDLGLGERVIYQPEMGSIVQPYLGPMISSLFLNCDSIDESHRRGFLAYVLCIGVGGGALVTCLRFRVGVAVIGVELDEMVLRIGKRHFGFVDGGLLKVYVEDGIKMLVDYGLEPQCNVLFHAIMVDLDEEDPLNGVGAPPAEFLKMSVVWGAKKALRPDGILVVNVIPSDESFYGRVIELFRMFFCELYELRVDDERHFVLVATVSPIGFDAGKMKRKGGVYEKLKELDCERFIDCIRRI